MNTLEANLIRSFSEVRKEIDDLRDQIKILKEHQGSLMKRALSAKSERVKKK
jgi:hypothetical protein